LNADAALDRIASNPAQTGIFCDFDGTLSEIVDRPEDARPVAGAADVLERLAHVFRVVAVITGRSVDDLGPRFAPAGVVIAGSYGRERSDRPGGFATRDWEPVASAAERATREWNGVNVERKRGGVAIHYRLTPDRASDVQTVASELAGEFGLEVRPGRMVADLTEPGPGKAEALARLVEEYGLATFLFAGDDVADAEAFAWARASGADRVLIGVRSAESPEAIERDADIVVESPHELLAILERLLAKLIA
jgi:trehalose 6-phosphate phosphatase